MGWGMVCSALFCVKMSSKRRVHTWKDRGVQGKGPTIVKGPSHKILNSMRWEKAGWGVRSAPVYVMKSKRRDG